MRRFTNNEKNLMLLLRNNGLKIKDIAIKVGLTAHQVRGFINRHAKRKNTFPIIIPHCIDCGSKVNYAGYGLCKRCIKQKKCL